MLVVFGILIISFAYGIVGFLFGQDILGGGEPSEEDDGLDGFSSEEEYDAYMDEPMG